MKKLKHIPISKEVQSIAFEKSIFSVSEAKRWAKKHGFVFSKVHRTQNLIKLRQYDPKYFKKSSFRVFEPREGVLMTIAQLKPGYTLE
jgi:hypothetical protein